MLEFKPAELSIWRLFIARLAIGVVLFFNLECAIVFLLTPQGYISGFELSGEVGTRMIQGMGILFVMWNVPYAFALIHPHPNHTSLLEAFIMQAIGFGGETLLYFRLEEGHTVLQNTIQRFILFDGGGLLLLLLAIIVVHPWTWKKPKKRNTHVHDSGFNGNTP